MVQPTQRRFRKKDAAFNPFAPLKLCRKTRFEASRAVFWSLSCYKEPKLTTKPFTGYTLRGLLISPSDKLPQNSSQKVARSSSNFTKSSSTLNQNDRIDSQNAASEVQKCNLNLLTSLPCLQTQLLQVAFRDTTVECYSFSYRIRIRIRLKTQLFFSVFKKKRVLSQRFRIVFARPHV